MIYDFDKGAKATQFKDVFSSNVAGAFGYLLVKGNLDLITIK